MRKAIAQSLFTRLLGGSCNEHSSIPDGHREASDDGRRIEGADAGPDLKRPLMPGAGHSPVADQTFPDGPSPMRTEVLQSENTVLQLEESHLTPFDVHDESVGVGNLFHLRGVEVLLVTECFGPPVEHDVRDYMPAWWGSRKTGEFRMESGDSILLLFRIKGIDSRLESPTSKRSLIFFVSVPRLGGRSLEPRRESGPAGRTNKCGNRNGIGERF